MPRTMFLPFSPPAVGEEEIAAVTAVSRSDRTTTGPRVAVSEAEFAAALAAHGVRAGDEVITTPTTFVATANLVEHVGARPVLVDVEPDAPNVGPAAVEAALTPHARALIRERPDEGAAAASERRGAQHALRAGVPEFVAPLRDVPSHADRPEADPRP